MNKVIPYRFLM